MKFVDLTGERFGRLTVLGRVWRLNNPYTFWLCKCDCGNLRVINGVSLKNGDSKSCGCFSTDSIVKHNTTHGLSGSKLYGVWSLMIKRCQNPRSKSFCDYGARGINVCDEWQLFEPFYEWAVSNGYQEGLEIDRIDNGEGYYPDNCRWVKRIQNANNKRNNRYIEYEGKTHTLSEWSRILNIDYWNLQNRLKRGWTIERAFTENVESRMTCEYSLN